jgi:hypothetical protein
MTIKKRGRPVGIKNKPKNPISDFQKALNEWDLNESENNWELIAKKQESRIAAYITENEELAKICVMRFEEIAHLKYLITYLERKNENSSV